MLILGADPTSDSEKLVSVTSVHNDSFKCDLVPNAVTYSCDVRSWWAEEEEDHVWGSGRTFDLQDRGAVCYHKDIFAQVHYGGIIHKRASQFSSTLLGWHIYVQSTEIT